METNKLLERQLVLAAEIESILKKLQKNEIRQVQLEATRTRANSVWAEFVDNDEVLSAGAFDHSYWKNNYKSGIEDLVRQIKTLIQEKLDVIGKKLFQEEATTELQRLAVTEQFTTSNIMSGIHNDHLSTPIATPKSEMGKEDRVIAQFNQVVGRFEASLEATQQDLIHCTKSVLEVGKEDLENNFIRFEQTHDKVVEMFEFHDEVERKYTEIRNYYYDIKKMIATKLEAFQEGPSKMQHAFTKLQEIKVPTFEGQKEAWASFYNVFELFVHKTEVSNVEKMLRLKAALRGEAAKLIQHLTITSDNYIVAWEILRQRYENQRLTFSTLVDRLLDQTILNSENSSSIRQLLDTTQECIKSIEAMGLKIEDAKPFIARIVLRKFDREAMRQYEFNIKRTREIQKLEDVLGFLDQMAQAQEALKVKRFVIPHQQKVNIKTSYSVTEQTCSYCKHGMHKIAECEKFLQLNVNERRSWVSKSNACWICLYHTKARRCYQTTRKCVKCNKLHHSLLHSDFTTNYQEKPTTSRGNDAKVNTYVTKEDESATILLATAHVRVKNMYGEFITLRALVDQGSQKTAISEEAAQILRLPRKKARTELYGLGDTLVGVSKSKIKLEILPRMHNKNKFYVEALVLQSLSNNKPDFSFDYDKSKWNNYCLADPEFNTSSRIDILIGVDMFHEILEGGVQKVGNVIGQATKLGWMISGVLKDSKHQKKMLSVTTTTTSITRNQISAATPDTPIPLQVSKYNGQYDNKQNKTAENVKTTSSANLRVGSHAEQTATSCSSLATDTAESTNTQSDIIQVYTAYNTGIASGNRLKLHITAKTTAREVINLVVKHLSMAAVLKGSSGPIYSADMLHNFCLVAIIGARELCLRDNFKPLFLQNPWKKGRLYVRQKHGKRADTHL